MYSNKNIYNTYNTHLQSVIRLLSFLLVFFSGGSTSILKAQSTQTTILKGKVTDVLSKEALTGVSFIFPGTSLGAVTDVKGNYKTTVCFQNIRFSYVGYKAIILPVTPGQVHVGIRGRFKFDF